VRIGLSPRPVPRVARAMAVTTVEPSPGPFRKFFKDLGF
jgi:hypothetical protein